MTRFLAAAALAVCVIGASAASAQTPTPAPTPAPPPNTTIKMDGALFADFTYNESPKIQDAAGRTVSLSQFAISRAYMSLQANLSPRIAARITADVTRETGTGSVLNGSYVFRVKYAYLHFDLTKWLGPHAWTRFGVQHTPFIDAVETIYRYRFQGTLFTERDASMSGADAGATLHLDLPGNHGDVHGGIFNGEGARGAETNDQKSLQFRATYKPWTGQTTLSGLSFQFFINRDHYLRDAPKQRLLLSSYFQHRRFNAGIDLLNAADQALPTSRRVDGRGYQVWVTPFFRTKGHGPEALIRFDRFQPDLLGLAVRHRIIIGAAYWFPREGSDYAAIMVDYEQFTTAHADPSFVAQRKLAVHAVVHF